MQHAPILPKNVVAQPFDSAIAVAWAVARRHDGVRLVVATDHESFPEVIEISPPGTTEPRWCIWQDTMGHLIVDNWQTWEPSRLFAGMADALDFIEEEIGTVKGIGPGRRGGISKAITLRISRKLEYESVYC
jgi:hypothetical protein